jgi:hypothetical protein
MRIRIDLSVFSSPTSAFGKADGEIEVAEVPKEREPFPWPSDWLAAKPAYFTPEQSLVWSVTEREGQPVVMLYGIVCNSVAEAQDCAVFLEDRGGLFLDEYEHPAPTREA